MGPNPEPWGNHITDCLAVVQSRVMILTSNRPIYVSFLELELSQLHMYDFHYNHMCVKYPCANQLRLLFTHTDSLPMLYRQTKSIKIWLMMPRIDVTASNLSTILVMMYQIVSRSNSSKMNWIQCLCENLSVYVQNITPFSVRVKWVIANVTMVNL